MKFFLGTADADVYRYLKLFTFQSMQNLDELMGSHDIDRSKRLAQHTLAMDVLRIVHGDEVAEKAKYDHSRLFQSHSGIAPDSIRAMLEQAKTEHSVEGRASGSESDSKSAGPSATVVLPRKLVNDQPIARVLWSAGLVDSISEGRRLCIAGGVYIGMKDSASATEDENFTFTSISKLAREDAAHYLQNGDVLLLRVGKRKIKAVLVISDEDFMARALTAPGWQNDEEM